MVRTVVIICLLGIVASLGFGLYYLRYDKGGSKRMAWALTVRVVLSIALFIFLLLAWQQGWIHPQEGLRK